MGALAEYFLMRYETTPIGIGTDFARGLNVIYNKRRLETIEWLSVKYK